MADSDLEGPNITASRVGIEIDVATADSDIGGPNITAAEVEIPLSVLTGQEFEVSTRTKMSAPVCRCLSRRAIGLFIV